VHFPIRSMVASKKRSAVAPSSASNDRSRLFDRLCHKIGSVRDELGVQAKRMAEGAFDLRGGIVIFLKATKLRI
jgi:hypothetical protein